jgi:hypothetical protein
MAEPLSTSFEVVDPITLTSAVNAVIASDAELLVVTVSLDADAVPLHVNEPLAPAAIATDTRNRRLPPCGIESTFSVSGLDGLIGHVAPLLAVHDTAVRVSPSASVNTNSMSLAFKAEGFERTKSRSVLDPPPTGDVAPDAVSVNLSPEFAGGGGGELEPEPPPPPPHAISMQVRTGKTHSRMRTWLCLSSSGHFLSCRRD